MVTYITAFIFYTLAMIGILLGGLVVYKKFFVISKNENKGMIKVIDSLAIAPKKSLMVVKIKNEKFLIASDAERTTFLSKLAPDNQTKKQEQEQFADNSQARLNNIQKQFQELYSKKEVEKPLLNAMQRKEMIRQLLRDLNDSNKGVMNG